jgi:hypothetical protein
MCKDSKSHVENATRQVERAMKLLGVTRKLGNKIEVDCDAPIYVAVSIDDSVSLYGLRTEDEIRGRDMSIFLLQRGLRDVVQIQYKLPKSTLIFQLIEIGSEVDFFIVNDTDKKQKRCRIRLLGKSWDVGWCFGSLLPEVTTR